MPIDTHSRHFHERQTDLLRRFAAIHATLLAGYEATAAEAERGIAAGEPFASVRLDWALRASAELRERMARDVRPT